MIVDRLLSPFADRDSEAGINPPTKAIRDGYLIDRCTRWSNGGRFTRPSTRQGHLSGRVLRAIQKMDTGSRTPDDEIPQSVHRRRTTRRPTVMQLLQTTGGDSRGIQLPREMTREPVLQNRQGRS